VVGDSITAWSLAPLKVSLSEYLLGVVATPEIDLAAGRTELIKPTVQSKPKVVVIELGINSAREVWDSKDLPHLEGILNDVKTIPCVIWVTPTALSPSYYDHLGKGTLQSRIEAFKASLRKRLPTHPNVHLADWAPIQLANPQWFNGNQLHLSPSGQKAYASYIDEQIAELCG
jgi:lysophospholipase L1-like esterase